MIRVQPPTATAAPASAAAPGTDTPAQARRLIEGQLAMLTRLAEMGMELAETAVRQATAAQRSDETSDETADDSRAGEAGAAPMRDPTLVYVRVARAVRMTIALQSRLMADLAALNRAADLADGQQAIARRTRLRRLVERAIEAGGGEGAGEGGKLSWKARERLDDADLEAEIDGLPVAEVVARICGDLGLAPERTARILASAGLFDTPPCLPPLDARPADPPRTRPDRRPAQSPSARPRPPPH